MKVFVMKDARIGRRTWKRGRQPPPFFDGRGQLTVSCRPSSSRPWLSSPLSVIPPFMWVLLARTLTSPLQRSEEHTSELQSQSNLVCRLLLEKKKNANLPLQDIPIRVKHIMDVDEVPKTDSAHH